MTCSSVRTATFAALLFLGILCRAAATDLDVNQKLTGFDAYMVKILSDWNAPGIGVGIVVNDKLVFAKGYGYRDYEKKLPFTPETLCPIASNTKLFTAVAAGMLVEEGKLTWDKPVRDSVPEIRFYNDQLTNSVTLRDMLSHRTGITRHDSIWYKSDFTRKELFDKLVYLEPQQPLRQTFLYNNLMFSAVGYIIELKSGKPWEEFVQQRILDPLDMKSTVYTIADMLKKPDFGVGFTERRDSNEIYRIPYYEDIAGVAPCGAIISNIDDMSHWLIALMNAGKYEGNTSPSTGNIKGSTRTGYSVTQYDARLDGLVGDFEFGLLHGPTDRVLSRPPLNFPWWRSPGIPLPNLFDATRPHRSDRLCDRRPHCDRRWVRLGESWT